MIAAQSPAWHAARRVLRAMIATALATTPGWARAERLLITRYTTTEGLAHDRVQHITQDAEGFLWFSAAGGGLSRFDGHQFVTYGFTEGLPNFTINQVLVGKGEYWVATNGGGACRFDPAAAAMDPRRRFRCHAVGDEPRTHRVNVLHRDRAGRLWAGTDGGLFRFVEDSGAGAFASVPLGLPQPDRVVGVWALAEDDRGHLWIGTTFGLVRRLPDGHMFGHPVAPAGGADLVRALVPVQGRVWVGHRTGLFVFDDHRGVPRFSRHVVGGEDVTALLATREALWVGTTRGLRRLEGANRDVVTENRLEPWVRTLFEDRDGQVWAGTQSQGAIRITPGGFSSYGEADGLSDPVIVSIFESLAGDLYVQDGPGRLFRLDGKRFRPLPAVVGSAGGMEARPSVLQDGSAEWWVATAGRLSRFGVAARLEDVHGRPPQATYARRHGLPEEPIIGLHEDSRGDLWLTVSRKALVLRWERATARLHRYAAGEGLDAPAAERSFCEDRAGNVWLGLADGGLARFRNGRFRRLGPADGLPPAHFTRDLMIDRSGRLWVTLGGAGLGRIDDPGADRPRVVLYTSDQGLSRTGARTLVEDDLGRIYIGSGSGVHRLDPATGEMRHYTTADGLAGTEQLVAFRARAGTLWFGSMRGLSQLNRVSADRTARAIPARISALRIAGVSLPVADLGQVHVRGPELETGRVPIEIDFLGVDPRPGAALRYQHRLAGTDSGWSAPTPQRTVTYAGLAAGEYRFEVQAVSASGTVRPAPAIVTFTVLQPLWRRPWFLTLAVLAVGLTAAAAYRARMAHLLAVERVRTRIATDLHDDIGSSLSRIAIMGEVVKRDVEGTHAEAGRLGGEIAASARALLESAGDIVWSIDPRRDDLGDLAARVRAFGTDLLEARGIGWRVDVEDGAGHVKLDPERRRHLFLLVKEALHNVARHARASGAGVRLGREGRRLVVEVHDDGCGFSPERSRPVSAHGGHGLPSLRARAAALGGRLEIVSHPGEGTLVRLEVPLRGGA